MSRTDGTRRYGFTPLAGVSAGTAGVLFAFGVLALAWHRVAGQVAAGVTVLVYAVIAAVCGLVLAAVFYVFLWLRYRVRHPEVLAGRPAAPAAEPVPQAVEAARPRVIEPPRVYLNVTPGQLEALVRQVTVTQLPRDDQG